MTRFETEARGNLEMAYWVNTAREDPGTGWIWKHPAVMKHVEEVILQKLKPGVYSDKLSSC